MQDYLKVFQNKKILITGGAGCIGSNLTKALLKAEPKKVIVLDDLSAAERWNVPEDPRVEFIKGNILDEEILKRAFFQEPAYIFHLAALFANQNSIDHPESDLLINGLGTLKILQYAKFTRPKKVIFASSGCSVYGSQSPLPLKESYFSLHLDSPYQITKLLGELYCNFFYNHYGLKTVRPRLFNIYGPGEIPGRYRNVIPNFIFWALQKKPLPIYGTGKETRDWTFVEDALEGILKAAALSKATGQAFNIASETETQVIKVAKLINRLTGNKAGLQFIPRRGWDKIIRRKASIAKAKKLLGYKPKTDIKKGIQKTLDWFKKNWKKVKKSARF